MLVTATTFAPRWTVYPSRRFPAHFCCKASDLCIPERSASRTVRLNGAALALTAVEFDLMATLLRAAGAAVRRPDLVREVLGRRFSPYDRSIDTHICNLRRKLGAHPDGSERIKRVRGAGYLYATRAAGGG